MATTSHQVACCACLLLLVVLEGVSPKTVVHSNKAKNKGASFNNDPPPPKKNDHPSNQDELSIHNDKMEDEIFAEERDEIKHKGKKNKSKHSPEDAPSRKKRAVWSDWDEGWTNYIVPYEFKSTLVEWRRVDIRHQMIRWEYYTMFRFVEKTETYKTDYDLDHDAYAYFFVGSGCYSAVGRWTTETSISCCSGFTCVHELGHLLGLLHEQQSPILDDLLRMNLDDVDGNINEFLTDPGIISHDYADMSSALAYKNWMLSKSGKKSMTLLDPDNYYMWSHENLFYNARELILQNDIAGNICSGFTATCKNGGYPSYVNGICQCMCPFGLTMDSDCKEKTQTASIVSSWPQGSYGLLKPTTGCAAGFASDGYLQVTGNSASISSLYTASPGSLPAEDTNAVRLEFCVKNDAASIAWEKGSYCLFKGASDCPTGFIDASVSLDGATVSSGGNRPDGTYTDHALTKYCCRDDAHYLVPITLPNTEPFIMFPIKEEECQRVKGMESRMEYFKFYNTSSENQNVTPFGPYTSLSESRTYVHHCFYYPVNYDCGEVRTLISGETYEFSTPNYPANYNTGQHCTWLFTGPENSHIVFEFESIALSRINDDTCEDTLEIRRTLPGQRGERFCDKGPNVGVFTETNFLALDLMSDEKNTMSGFKAKVRLIKTEDLCYSDGGRRGSYSGTVSITTHLDDCLPWSEVVHCTHHLFEAGDFSDSLEKNYCRNPGHGDRPWCYTNLLCDRGYCDVCGFSDLCQDTYDDCAELNDRQDEFCRYHKVECRGTCDMCDCKNSPTDYTGKQSFINEHITCQRWDNHFPWYQYYFQDAEEDFGVATLAEVKNYCRNPDADSAPWCYTLSSENRWEYCDIPDCGTQEAEDCGDTSDTCAQDIANLPNACHDNFKSHCDKTCSTCSTVTSSAIPCEAPTTLPSASICPDQTTYNLGDTVTHTCLDNVIEKKVQVCSSDGTWQPELSYVCGACPDGWSRRAGKCVQILDDIVMYSTAKSKCQAIGGLLMSDKNDEENDAIKAEMYRQRDRDGVWLGMRLSLEKKIFEWEDGSRVTNTRTRDDWDLSCISDVQAYKGTKSNTQTNITCQRWDKQEPHSQSYGQYLDPVDRATNYCRDPDSDEGTLWCYTMDAYVRWDFCGIPSCDTKTNDCFYRNWDGQWLQDQCDEEHGVICQYTPSARSTCADQDSNCHDVILKVPDVKTRYPDFAYEQCARSTGVCSASGDVQECANPGAVAQSTLTSGGSGSIPVGDTVVYSCNQGYGLSAGNLQRVCQPDGSFSGAEPVCTDVSVLTQWNNDVTLAKNAGSLYGTYVYTSLDDHMLISRPGKVKAWRFYSTKISDLTLLVLRKTSSTTYTVVGQTYIYARNSRAMLVELDPAEQIEVLADDRIAILSGDTDEAGPSYSPCSDTTSTLKSDSRYSYEDLTDGETVTFSTYDTCAIFSVSALIGA